MPQATDELRSKFPGWDSEALDVLRPNFTVARNGVIRPKTSNYEPTERESDAIDYLIQEWDYGYSPEAREREDK